jgi:hypothetical protein
MHTARKLLSQTLVPLLALLLLPSLLFSQAYPIKLEQAITFESLSVSVNRVLLHAGKGALVLIECEKGITGAVVLASGSFSFATKDTQSIHDTFTNALLRFNPADYSDFIALVGAKPGSQAELIDQTTTVLRGAFRRLYHKGNDALIPDAGILGCVVTADNLGELIISEGGDRSGVFSMRDRRALFDGGVSAPVPVFETISKNWLPRVNHQRMDGVWLREGIGASGDNYFYLPVPASGKTFSQRFDPTSTYFQSWFGMYVVKDLESGKYGFAGSQPDTRAITKLSIADQRSWLKNFAGLQDVVVQLDEKVPITCVQASAAGLTGWKISAHLLSNVDVGEKNPQSGRPEFLLVAPIVWKGSVDSYARVSLDVVAYVFYNAESRETYVVYYNGVDFLDKKGMRHRTLPVIQGEMEGMVGSLKVPKK